MMPDAVRAQDEPALDLLLAEVQRPGRYVGGEWNEVVKDHRSVELTVALAFPDVYEIGMSHLGLRILYSLLNAREDTAVERCFCPWPDMAGALRRRGVPLSTLETGTPIAAMDVVGFSLQYEMTFTNVLEMLDLAGIPLRSADRREHDPLCIAGGPIVFNVEPLADYLDLVLVGDGEELVPEFLDRLRELKRAGASRSERIRELAGIEGVYAPSLYPVERDAVTGLLVPADAGAAPWPVRRRIVMDLDRFPFPERILVPHGEIVHDRVSVELMRGCPVGCRFCQAGYVYRPKRERDPNQVRECVVASVRATGYDSFALSSLNSGHYGAVQPLLLDLMDAFEPERVSVSMSSMHASTLTPEVAGQLRRVRTSGLTIAPEAGTQRLRDVINKNLTEDQILTACRLAFEAGWEQVKLYGMIGLPTETDADVDELAALAGRIHALGRRVLRGRRVEVTLSVSSFVPKPATPFQWVGMDRVPSLAAKQERLARRSGRGVRFKGHDIPTSLLEAVFSRGDRALCRVVERAWRAGARFDGWSEHARPDAWRAAFQAEGLDPARYAHRDLDPAGRLPWDVVDPGISRRWLEAELQRALEGAVLSPCGPEDCHACGPFARDCITGVVASTTGRPLLSRALLPTGEAEGEQTDPGEAAAAGVRGVQPPEDRRRYRVRFAKRGRLRFLGHLDLAHALLRGMRRARLPLAWSQGFNPKPRVAFGPALPVGISSESELLDVETIAPVDPERLVDEVNAVLPRDLRFLEAREIGKGAPALSEAVRAARYVVTARDGVDLARAWTSFREHGPRTIRRERESGAIDLPVDATLLDGGAADARTLTWTLRLGAQGGSIRPDELLSAVLGDSAPRARVTREALLVEANGRLSDAMGAATGGS